MEAKKKLRSLSDIRRYFHRNETPIYFVSATNFNLLGLDEWVHNFRFINYIDCFDNNHPSVIVPTELPHDTFESIEDINNYLLSHKEIADLVRSRAPAGKAVFLMFDEKTEKLCEELGLEICFPSAALREEIDNKISTVRICNRAGVDSVPNYLGKIESYHDLRAKTEALGDDLVIQTAFGDSGHTTFFISDEDDWKKHDDEITREAEVKVMKKIRCRGSAIEACVTRHGTIVGPLMTELVGFSELTPYKGGWCGNEVFAEAFSPAIRAKARDNTFKIGQELQKMGYRGYFECDYLSDLDNGELYLGEINPRVTGASSMTNLAAFAHADAPLFLFHLLEYSNADFELDVAAINERWSDPENIDSWSQMVIKHPVDSVDIITEAPPSGIWRLREDGVEFVRVQTHRRTVRGETEAFFLRIARVGDYRYEGADLGILITPGRLMTDDHDLTERARRWIGGIRSRFNGRPVTTDPNPVADIGGFKLM